MNVVPVLLLLAGTFVSCKNDLDKVAAVEMPASAPDRTVEQAEYFYSDSGQVRNRLRAGRLEEYYGEAERTVLSQGVELLFFTLSGDTGSRLTAEQGVILSQKARMEVERNVVFTNRKGERLETEHLIWSQDSGRVHTDRFVKITRANDIIHGTGLEANEDFSRYTIKKITGTLYIDPETDAQGQ